jgi:putative tricarboxylic transport membrane protein
MPAAPFIIGFILGPMAETNLRRGLMLSDGNFMGFLGNPISASFLFLAAASIGWNLFSSLRGSKNGVGKLLRS